MKELKLTPELAANQFGALAHETRLIGSWSGVEGAGGSVCMRAPYTHVWSDLRGTSRVHAPVCRMPT